MKKFLVVLLVLAVAGGVFAQEEGEWTLGGRAEIGVAIDFEPDDAMSFGTGINELYKGWGPIEGTFKIGYNKGGFAGSFNLEARDTKGVFSAVSYNGERYGFVFDQNLLKVTGGDQGSSDPAVSMGTRRLWGYYNLLNDLIYLEAAYNARDNAEGFWTSDLTATAFQEGAGWPWYNAYPDFSTVPGTWAGNALWGDGNAFTHTDHGTAFVTDVRLSGLSFGVFLRDLFSGTQGTPQYFLSSPDDPITGEKTYDAVLQKMVLGAKFEMHPVEAAIQFKLENYGMYFGGKAFFGPLTVGLSFIGEFPTTDASFMDVGVKVAYVADIFGASIRGWYALDTVDSNNKASQIAIEPSFYYNVIPTHLQFKADIGFYFNTPTVGGVEGDMKVLWALQPQLWWNFAGTGAGGFWDATGMFIRYRMVRDANNTVDIGFKWNMY